MQSSSLSDHQLTWKAIKMTSNQGMKILFVLAGLILLSVIGYLYMKPSWNVGLRNGKKEPYDLSIFRAYLEKSGDSFLEIKDTSYVLLRDSKIINHTLICPAIYSKANGEKLDLIRSFIERGNNVLIIQRSFDRYLSEQILQADCGFNNFGWTGNIIDSNITMKWNNDKTESQKYTHIENAKSTQYNWIYLKKDTLCHHYHKSTDLSYLGNSKDKCNFRKFEIGAGNLFLNSSPEFFTNYHLVGNKNHQQYVDDVLKLTKNKNYILDWNIKKPFAQRQTSSRNPKRYGESDLRIILQHKGLRFAWYLLLVLSSIYLILNRKRTQKSMPILIEKKNTSLNFIQTISRLYFQRNAHRSIGQKLWKHFLYDLKNRYPGVDSSNSESLKDSLVKIKKLEEKDIDKLLEHHKALDYLEEVSSSFLMEFYKQIEKLKNRLEL